MNSIRIIASLLFLPILIFAQYTGGSGDGFAVWASQGDIPLPVELLSHEEVITQAGIQLKWETASELENRGFIIKRKKNDQLFEPISDYLQNNTLEGMGNSSYGKSYQFTDIHVIKNESYSYQVVSVSISGEQALVFQTAEIIYKTPDIPVTYELFQNYPNPFNPQTRIVFINNMNARVKISVYTILGELVVVLADKVFEAGKQEVDFIPDKNQSSQVFICRVESDGIIKHFKMIYAK